MAGNVNQPVAERVKTRGWCRRILFTDDLHHLQQRASPQLLRLERGRPGQQLVEQHAKRVDVAAPVDLDAAQFRLLRAHVRRGPDELPVRREQRLLRQTLVRGLGDPEINDLGDWGPVVKRDQHVGRLDVAMDDPLVVGVVDGLADVGEEIQPLARAEVIGVTVGRDGNAFHQLHHEIRPARVRRADVQHRRDVGMVHHRQRLAFGLESGNDLLGVHPYLDDLDRDPAPDWLLLLSRAPRTATPGQRPTPASRSAPTGPASSRSPPPKGGEEAQPDNVGGREVLFF